MNLTCKKPVLRWKFYDESNGKYLCIYYLYTEGEKKTKICMHLF